MLFVHAFILGNLVVVFFNVVGMLSGMKPPPLWAYAVGWPAAIATIYFAGNA